MRHVPNLLTLSRIALTAVMVWCVLLPGLLPKCMAAGLFVLAAITDFADGHLAKTRNLHSDFGRLLDPIADKVLVLSLLATFAVLRIIPWWMVIVVCGREGLVTALRMAAVRRGRVLSAERGGKWKTVIQMTVIGVVLAHLVVLESGVTRGTWTVAQERAWHTGIWWLMCGAVLITMWSGAAYVRAYWALFRRGDAVPAQEAPDNLHR